MDLIKTTKPIARKNYGCDGYSQIDNLWGVDELYTISKGKYNIKPHNIAKGERYICQVWREGTLYNFRTCKNCNDAINKYEIWPN